MTLHRFTQHPDVQKGIVEDLETVLAEAREGKLQGILIATHDRDGLVQTFVAAENRYTLLGAAFAGLSCRAARWENEG